MHIKDPCLILGDYKLPFLTNTSIESNMKTLLHILVLCLISASFESSAYALESPKKQSTSLYQRIGGQPAIDAAVELFYKKVLADKRVNHFFEDVSMKKQRKKQKAFLAAALGGPIPYKGKDLRKAHASLDLKESDFGAIAEHLQATLEELKVDAKLIGEVMAVVATTKDAVLNRKPAK